MTRSPAARPPFIGKVALVTGASRGIGAVTARAFAGAGAAVVLAARDSQALDAVTAEIVSAGGRAIAVPTDVGEASSVEALVRTTLERFGRLDAAFNNATDGPRPAPLADIDPDAFDRGIRTNIHGTFLGMKYQIPAMLRSGGGAIVNMASVAGVQGVAQLAAYVAAKAGIIGLTQVAALDYADQGIRVNVVAPGPILTHHLERAGAEAQRQAAQATPMRRVGRAAEVATTVLWLCSDEASFVTGATVPIDGGQLAGLKPVRVYDAGRPMQPAGPADRVDRTSPADARGSIGRDALRAAIAGREVIVVDALPAAPYRQRHLPGALNLVSDDAPAKARAVLPDPGAAIVTYSTNPSCGRGEALAETLRALGYANVRVYRGGIEDWLDAGLPLEAGQA